MPTGKPLRLDAAHARRFFVARHLLAPPRALAARPSSVLAVTARFGSLQLDPLASTGARNHDLVLAARVRGHRPEWVHRFLYGAPEERVLFEAFNKSLNVLPLADLPLHRVAWDAARARYEAPGGIFAQHPRLRAAVLARLGRDGPLPASAFATKGDAEITWGWGKATATKGMLEALFSAGEIAVAGRDGSVKTYHLTDALFPAPLLARRVPPEDALRHRVLSRFRAVGLLGAVASAEVWLGTGRATARRAVIADLVAEGALVAVAIDGVRGERFVLSGELPILERTGRPRRADAAKDVALLAPLDPFMWDRRLVRDLFGFEYRWEVYTPAAKRRYGYYVLPLLYGDALVGRIEPRFDRRAGVLHVELLALEPAARGALPPAFGAALDDALAAHAAVAGAREIRWRRTLRSQALRRA